jgi:hypothetical protein
MKSISYLIVASMFLFSACKKTEDVAVVVKPVSERIQKVWTAQKVTEGSSIVYTKGASNNTKTGYSQFKLSISAGNNVSLTEFDGNTFVGQWELSVDEKTLTLKNLSPQPTGTGGTITYSVTTFTDTAMSINRTSPSAKTGGVVSSYELVNP